MSSDPVRRWRISRHVQRFLRNRLGVPRPTAYRLVNVGASLTAPGEFLRRRRAARQLLAEPDRLPRISLADGFLPFGAEEVPGADAAIDACLKIWEPVRAGDAPSPTLRDGYTKQEFLLPVMHGNTAAGHPAIFDFVLSPTVLQAVARYFGSIPVLTKVHILWTKPNATAGSSQLFHLDAEDTTELKLFLYAVDVDEHTGPFTLIPAATSQRIKKRIGYDGERIAPDEMRALCAEEDWTVVTGPRGSGVLVDTARCFHFGSCENRRDRVVLMVQFILYFGANFKAVRWISAVKESGRKLDPLARMVMPV